MILLRYFSRETFATMFAVAGIVLVISVGWRFSAYLDKAAAGTMTQEVLLALMFYRLPGFLELIVPLSFFLAIMLVYGRLYVDNEMIVLHSCGMSTRRLMGMTLLMSLIVMLITALLSLWLKPLGEQRVEALLRSQQQLTEFDTLIPGRFQALSSGKRVTYTEGFTPDGDLSGVFINEYKTIHGGNGPRSAVTVIAESGSTQVDSSGRRFLVLEKGRRYQGTPGTRGYQIISYEEYGQLVDSTVVDNLKTRRAAISTGALLKNDTPEAAAEFHWRISVILLVPVIALMAVPLAKVNPRQGRFTRLVPATILCFLYILMLSGAQSALEKGDLPKELGLWWVHGLFFFIAVCIYQWDRVARVFSRLTGH
ncbi:MAG: LPS export ABC transporter permease LptF [Pseudomonadales bacterium]|nr:LPS export ABC transporter permease LptF [Pseudomonadales bacterium]